MVEDRKKLNFKLKIDTSDFNNIICYESMDIEILDNLLNSDLLLETFSDKMRTKQYDNEKTQLLAYRKNYNKETKQVKVKYCKSKHLNGIGRVLPVGSLGLHNIRRQIRHTLAKNKYVDIDIVCAHHEILLQLCKKNTVYCPNLEHYVKNREKMLNHVMNTYKVSREVSKNLFIRLLYFGSFQKWADDNNLVNAEISENLKCFYNEIKKIGQLIVKDNKDLYLLAKANNRKEFFNATGSTVSYYLQEYECYILMEMYKYCLNNGYIENDNVALCADGIMIQIELYKPSLLNELQEHINKVTGFNLTFKNKPLDEDFLSILKNHIINNENFDLSDYEKIKNEFEKNHFMIEHPLMFGRTYKKNKYEDYGLYNKVDFKDLVKKNKYLYKKESISKDGKKSYSSKDLFDDWIRDENIRSYKNINFVPKTNLEDINSLQANKEYFNTFQGFEGEYLTNKVNLDDEESKEIIEIFKNHIGLLTNFDKTSITYMLNYIADIIQNPDKLPAVAVMFKSKQGFGKDLFLDIISRMIGNKYLYRTANLDEVFGSFNTSIKDKIILQLNELEGKDGFHQKEKIKNLITEEYTNINEKKIKQYKQNNYIRMFIMTNNLSPIEIPADDRRFVVFKADFKKPSSSYFNKLVNLKNDDYSIKVLYEYFKNYDIILNLRNDRPKTNAYKDLQENCINPIYKYLNNLFINENIKDYYEKEEYKIHKKTGNILIKSVDFYQNYKKYLASEDLNYMKISFKLIKSLLNDIEINKKQIKINDENNDYYLFNKESLKEHLKHMNLVDDILEYNEDDFY